MKKIYFILSLIFMLLFSTVNVNAASFTITSSKNKPTIGSTFQVTVKVSGYQGKFEFSCSSNLKIDKTQSWIEDGKSINLSVTALSEGPATVTVNTSDVSTTDANPQSVSLSKSVNVTVVNNENPPSNNNSSSNNSSSNNSSTPVKDTRSGVNTLSSLEVSGGTLSPSFKSDKKNYIVDLPAGTYETTISAKSTDSKSSISGTGKKKLNVGKNEFSIICTAENGAKRYYSLIINVDESPTVFVNFDGKQLGFVTNLSKVNVPTGFSEVSTSYNSNSITCWNNEKVSLTIVYLSDDNNSKDFYIWDDEEVIRKFEVLLIDNKNYYIIDIPNNIKDQIGLQSSTVNINDIELEGWKFEDETRKDFCVVYLMNMSGEKNLYSYDTVEETLQRYVPSDNSKEKELETKMYIFVGTTGLFLLTTVGAIYRYMSFKKKSISVIKDYYQSKNIDE